MVEAGGMELKNSERETFIGRATMGLGENLVLGKSPDHLMPITKVLL